jgi:hypothetical protein
MWRSHEGSRRSWVCRKYIHPCISSLKFWCLACEDDALQYAYQLNAQFPNKDEVTHAAVWSLSDRQYTLSHRCNDCSDLQGGQHTWLSMAMYVHDLYQLLNFSGGLLAVEDSVSRQPLSRAVLFTFSLRHLKIYPANCLVGLLADRIGSDPDQDPRMLEVLNPYPHPAVRNPRMCGSTADCSYTRLTAENGSLLQ